MKLSLKEFWKKNYLFFGFLTISTIVLFLLFFSNAVEQISCTTLAFSYEYGFISRGLVGSVFALINAITPFDMMNNTWAKIFTLGGFFIFVVTLFIFYWVCLKYMKTEYNRHTWYLILFFQMFAIPMFSCYYNFGRSDMYMYGLALISGMVLISGSCTWLIIPLCALAVMVHQGFVFMFVNIVLVTLLYLAYKNRDTKKKNEYLIYFVLVFITVSILFLYFELFSHGKGHDYYDIILANAESLCEGTALGVHYEVIDKEILGISLADSEVTYRLQARLGTLIYMLFMSPYIFLFVRFFKRVISSAKKGLERLVYIMILAGSLTLAPEFLLKCDYARWIFAFIAYYFSIILILLALHDEIIECEVKRMMSELKCSPWGIILLIYPFLMQPLATVWPNDFSAKIMQQLNLVLGLW